MTAPPRTRPVVPVSFQDADGDDPIGRRRRLDITVDRLAGLGAAMEAYRALAQAPDWARTGGAPIETGSLTDVLRATVPVHTVPSGCRHRLDRAAPAPAGRLVRHHRHALPTSAPGPPPGHATWPSTRVVTTTRTMVWVNDSRRAARSPARPSASPTPAWAAPTPRASGSRPTPRPARVVADSATPPVRHRSRRRRPDDVRARRRSGVCGKCDLGAGADAGRTTPGGTCSPSTARATAAPTRPMSGASRDRETAARAPIASRFGCVRRLTAPTHARSPPSWSGTSRPRPPGRSCATVPFRDLPPGDYQVQVVAGWRRCRRGRASAVGHHRQARLRPDGDDGQARGHRRRPRSSRRRRRRSSRARRSPASI